MTRPFLERFVDQLLAALERHGEIALDGGQRARVVVDVAAALATQGEGAQAVSALGRALVAHEAVEELFADDARLYELIGDLGITWTRG